MAKKQKDTSNCRFLRARLHLLLQLDLHLDSTALTSLNLQNSSTQEQPIRRRLIIPVVITVYADRSFSFVTKTPPAPVLIKKACNIKSGSATPNKAKVATLSKAKLQEIAELKMPDLNAASLEAAMSMIAGTARSMGVTVEE